MGLVNVQKRCRHGAMLFNPRDRYVGRSLDLYGEFSHGEVELFEQVVRPGEVVVEVGANLGAHTVRLAQLAGPTGRVHAFEPQRVIFQTLCANIALNSLDNVVCFNQAVGPEPGVLAVPRLDYGSDNNYGGLELGSDAHWRRTAPDPSRIPTETVPVVTLDGLGLDRCRLLKVDVEGMERDVLRGAGDMIARTRPLLYVENDREDRAEALVAHLRALGYDLYWHDPPLFNPKNFAGNAENVFGRIISINVFGIPKEHRANLNGFTPVEDPLHPVMRRARTP